MDDIEAVPALFARNTHIARLAPELFLDEPFHLATVHAPFDSCGDGDAVDLYVFAGVVYSTPVIIDGVKEIFTCDFNLLCHSCSFLIVYHASLLNHPSERNQASVLHSTSTAGNAGPT